MQNFLTMLGGGKNMNYLKTLAVLCLGFLLGVLTHRPIPSAHASNPTMLHLHTLEIPKGGDLLVMPGQGSQVVGFSCISIPGQSRCFVETME
jgi:hypothetical protein